MIGPLYYPKAHRNKAWWYQGGPWAGVGITMPMTHVKWVQHTTESAGGWPNYQARDAQGQPYGPPGAYSPNFTYEPWLHEWRQHLDVNHSGRALSGSGTQYTNRWDAVQVEISCYCDPAEGAKYGHFVENLDDQALQDLADFAAWLHLEWGMDLQFYPSQINWPRYNGQQNVTRMDYAPYDTWSGILGHEAIPGEEHLDPGSLDNVSIKSLAEEALKHHGAGGAQGLPFPLVDVAAQKAFAVVKANEDLTAALDACKADQLQAVVDGKEAATEMQARAKARAMALHQVNFLPK